MHRSPTAWLAMLVAALAAASASASAESVRYRLVLEVTWSAATHPHEWPAGGGHLSDLTGATHNSRYVMFADGRTASSGLRLVAENGRSAIMEAEYGDARRRERIGETFRAEGIAQVPGRITVEFAATGAHPRVSFVTMLAPSPDWFTGTASLDLRPRGAWVERLQGPLMVWDAGTDSGTTYVAENAETQPAESTRLLATPHFLGRDGVAPIGTWVVERIR